jgi:hypothetical protein
MVGWIGGVGLGKSGSLKGGGEECGGWWVNRPVESFRRVSREYLVKVSRMMTMVMRATRDATRGCCCLDDDYCCCAVWCGRVCTKRWLCGSGSGLLLTSDRVCDQALRT